MAEHRGGVEIEIRGGWFADEDIGVAAAEFIFGKYFISTGGKNTTGRLVRSFRHLKEGGRVLDIGSGFGGMAFEVARQHGVYVHGVDITAKNVSVASNYLSQQEQRVQEKVTFENKDIFHSTFEPNSFDFVYSRDTLMYVENKKALLEKIFAWLKPGGGIAILDLCEGEIAEHSENYISWASAWHYFALTLPAYEDLLREVGFVDIECVERNTDAIEDLKKELQRLEDEKDTVVKNFGNSGHTFLTGEWKAKVERFVDGESVFGHFTAKKPQISS